MHTPASIRANLNCRQQPGVHVLTQAALSADLNRLEEIEQGHIHVDGETVYDRIQHGSTEYLAAPRDKLAVVSNGPVTIVFAEREWLASWRDDQEREKGWYEVTTDFGTRTAVWWDGRAWSIPSSDGTRVLDAPRPVRLIPKEA